MQRAQVFAQGEQIGLVGLQLGQALGLQQVAHLVVEFVAQLAQLLLAVTAAGFEALPFLLS